MRINAEAFIPRTKHAALHTVSALISNTMTQSSIVCKEPAITSY